MTPRPPTALATAPLMLLTISRGVKCTARGTDEPGSGGKLQLSMPKWVMATIWCLARSAGSAITGFSAR